MVLGLSTEALDQLSTALAEAHQLGNAEVVANSLYRLGNACGMSGHLDKAKSYYEQAMALFKELDLKQNQGIILGNLANIYSLQGQLHEAQELLKQALMNHRNCGDRKFEGIATGNLANCMSDLGLLEESERLYLSALEIHRECGDRQPYGKLWSKHDWYRFYSSSTV